MTTTLSRYFRIFFHRATRGGKLAHRVFSKGLTDYNRLFRYSDLDYIHHVSIEFDGLYVEVLEDGTLVEQDYLINPLTDAQGRDYYDIMPRLEAYWEYALDDLSDDAIDAHKFVLKQMAGKKLDIKGSLKYAAELAVAEFYGYEASEEDFGEKPFAHVKEGTLKYVLPFTCTTPANKLLWKVCETETAPDSLIAPNLLITCWLMAGFGCGDLYSSIALDFMFF